MQNNYLISIREKVKIINVSPAIVDSRLWNIVKAEILYYLSAKKIFAISTMEGKQLFGLKEELMYLMLDQLHNENKPKSLN